MLTFQLNGCWFCHGYVYLWYNHFFKTYSKTFFLTDYLYRASQLTGHTLEVKLNTLLLTRETVKMECESWGGGRDLLWTEFVQLRSDQQSWYFSRLCLSQLVFSQWGRHSWLSICLKWLVPQMLILQMFFSCILRHEFQQMELCAWFYYAR